MIQQVFYKLNDVYQLMVNKKKQHIHLLVCFFLLFCFKDPDESILLLNNETKSISNSDDTNDEQLRLYHHDIKTRHQYTSNWHDSPQYIQTTKDEPHPQQQQQQHYYNPPPPSSSSTTTSYRTNTKQSSSTSDPTYMIIKQSQPSQRCYKTNSLDQNNDNGIVIVERCQLRAQSVDTNNNSNTNLNHSDHTVSRRNLQTIVEAIRHLEGDDALSNITSQQSTSQTEDLPAQIKAMINEKFQQQQQQQQQQQIIKVHHQQIQYINKQLVYMINNIQHHYHMILMDIKNHQKNVK